MLIVTCDNSVIKVENLPPKFRNYKIDNEIDDHILELEYKTAFNKVISNFERSFILHHLQKNNYNISQTAGSINLSRVSLHKKIKEYSIPLLN
jgi:transcriptional regulator of acetoin/glycerol metabolism